MGHWVWSKTFARFFKLVAWTASRIAGGLDRKANGNESRSWAGPDEKRGREKVLGR